MASFGLYYAFKTTEIASIGNYYNDYIFFTVLVRRLIEKIVPSLKVVVIYCDFLEMSYKLLVFLDKGRNFESRNS